MQLTDKPDLTPPLNAADTLYLQQVVGTLLYYARAVDPTMLVALGTLAEQQSHGTQQTLEAIVQLLNYAATHPNATIRYHASNMILHIDSDASYLSMLQARSRAGGFFYLSNRPTTPTVAPTVTPKLNGAILVTSNRIRNVMASAAEAEIAALFDNGQEAVSLRHTLQEMGYTQPPTPIRTDNTTAVGFANHTIKQKRSKAIDMRFYWIRDRANQQQFIIYWGPGSANLADYFTKHHSPAHHQQVRSTYLHEK